MTQRDFLNRLAMLAKVCQFELTKDWIALYDRALERFGYDRATAAVEAAIMERRGRDGMPSIGDLVQRCAPQIQDADNAVEVSARIISAVPKFGRYAADADVRDWVGEIAWYVISNNGGWKQVCGTFGLVTDAREVANWRAQFRDQAAAAIRRHKAGVLGEAPSFGELPSNRVTALIGQVLNKKGQESGSTGNVRSLPPPPSGRELNAEGDPRVPEKV